MKKIIEEFIYKIQIWRVLRLTERILDLEARIAYWENRDYQLDHNLSPYRYAEIEDWKARLDVLRFRYKLLTQIIKIEAEK